MNTVVINVEIQPEHEGNPRAEAKRFPEVSGSISPYIPTRVIVQAFSISKYHASIIVFSGRAILEKLIFNIALTDGPSFHVLPSR